MARPFAEKLSQLGSSNRLAASLYYAFFRRNYAREQMAFLSGMKAYQQSVDSPTGTMALIRRNIHRLEKGLLMRPRRIPFAADYIGETVGAYVSASRSGMSIDLSEWTWATDVLREYFTVHADVASMSQVKEQFSQAAAVAARDQRLPAQIPYVRNLSDHPVSPASLLELAKKRRSVRWFLPLPVDRGIIDLAVEIGTLAPSACNRQPFEFRICDDPDLVRKVIDIPFGLQGYGHNVPAVVVVIGQQRHYFDERDRHLIYIDASLAVMGFLFALESQGIGTCCVNWPDIPQNETQMAALLNLSPDERPVMLIAFGHPDPEGMVACSTKKSLPQIRRYNFE